MSDDYGPRKRTHHHCTSLPTSSMYERSWLHRSSLLHVLVTPTNFVLSSSRDGRIKQWKHVLGSPVLEFIKTFDSHAPHSVSSLSSSLDGERACSTSANDRSVRFYALRTFDMTNWIRTEEGFGPGVSVWTGKDSCVIANEFDCRMRVYDASSGTTRREFKVGANPVRGMGWDEVNECVVCGDSSGVLSYWAEAGAPRCCEEMGFKMDTDLFELVKKKTKPVHVACGGKMSTFAVASDDGCVRVFEVKTGRLVWTTRFSFPGGGEEDPDVEWLTALKANSDSVPKPTCIFDSAGQMLLIPGSLGHGILIFDMDDVLGAASPTTEIKPCLVLGKVEITERFASLALYQGMLERDYQVASSSSSSSAAATDPSSLADEEDEKQIQPLLLCTALNKDRFYAFTKREPKEEGRDVLNEKPTKAQIENKLAEERKKRAKGLPQIMVLHTTLGDVRIRLFPLDCPRTVENFVGHATQKKTYDGVIFHRVIRGFMVQTGDPQGDGTGGESIWGGEFEDEIRENLKHDRPFIVSMANAGSNTNGSQFFITTAPCPHLNGKHTVFGVVEGEAGQETVKRIERAKVDSNDRPTTDVKILNVSVVEE